MAPDIVWDNSLAVDGGVYRGHEGVRESTRPWLGAWRDQRIEPERIVEHGPHVVVVCRFHAVSRTTGIALEPVKQCFVWTMRGGKAVHWKHFLDNEEEALAYARGGGELTFPAVMGIVNVTPDSFSDGGLYLEADAAVAHGLRLASEGAAILDVGGESTRPGAEPVSEEEELRRVLPVVEGLARAGARVSIDTTKTDVARAALGAGASLVNDVSAFRFAPEMAGLVAEASAGCCLMHMLGEPRTMQEDPRYEDVVSEVKAFLEERLGFAVAAGVPEERVWLDPGIGFGKTVEHNLELLRRLDEIVALGRPVVVGTSRKSFLGKLVGGCPEEERIAAQPAEPTACARRRLPGTIATNVLAYERGASVFRVHDVADVVQALTVTTATVGS